MFSHADRGPSVPKRTNLLIPHFQSTRTTHVATTFGWTMALEMAASLMMASGYCGVVIVDPPPRVDWLWRLLAPYCWRSKRTVCDHTHVTCA